jgi:hypothetical protein
MLPGSGYVYQEQSSMKGAAMLALDHLNGQRACAAAGSR